MTRVQADGSLAGSERAGMELRQEARAQRWQLEGACSPFKADF